MILKHAMNMTDIRTSNSNKQQEHKGCIRVKIHYLSPTQKYHLPFSGQIQVLSKREDTTLCVHDFNILFKSLRISR